MKPKIKDENIPYVIMGAINEKKITPYIKKRYGENMEILTSMIDSSHYNTIDYMDKITGDKVEVKSRSCGLKAYKDTLVGDNKVQEYKKLIAEGKRCWFVFVFTDGSYEWEYTTANYEKNEIEQKARGMQSIRTANSNYKAPTDKYTPFNPNKPHLYILINNLSLLCDVCAVIPAGVRKPSTSIFGTGICYIKI